MYVRVVTSKQKSKTYRSVQLVESFRDPEKGGKPRTRVLLHLGNVADLTTEKVDRLVDGLLKATGRPPLKSEAVGLPVARDFGHIWALLGIWKALKIGTILRKKAESSRRQFDLEAHIRLMVVNRLCDPRSKLGLLAWLEGVFVPGIDKVQITHDNLLRAMDFLLEQKPEVEREVFEEVRTLFDDQLEMVFYDLTSTYFEGGKSVAAQDVRKYGYSRDHRSDRKQIVIGMVTTTDGIPVAHHVFAGNTLDRKTVGFVIEDLRKRFGIERVTFVGDRGLMSEENREAIRGAEMDYLLAHGLRRDADSKGILERAAESLDRARKEGREAFLAAGMYSERPDDHFAVAYSPEVARTSREGREERISKADEFIVETLEKLRRAQDPAAPRSRGRKLTLDGARLRIHDYLRDHDLLRLYVVAPDPGAPLGLRVEAKEEVRRREERIDGILVVETSRKDLSAQQMIEKYKDLAEIERSWRALKSSIRLRPVFHWTEARIRAHVFICVLALVVERVMRKRLAGSGTSAQTAMDVLSRIKAGVVSVGTRKVPALTPVDEVASRLYQQLDLPLPRVREVAELVRDSV